MRSASSSKAARPSGSSASETMAMVVGPAALSAAAAAAGSPPHDSCPSVTRITVRGPVALARSSTAASRESAIAVCDKSFGWISPTAAKAFALSSGPSGTSRRVSHEFVATCPKARSEKGVPSASAVPMSSSSARFAATMRCSPLGRGWPIEPEASNTTCTAAPPASPPGSTLSVPGPGGAT